MAATIIYKNGGERDWHIGQKSFSRKSDIFDVDSVQVDGDELDIIQGFGIDKFERERVLVLYGVDATWYCVLIFHLYSNSKQPIITEQGINNILNGDCNALGN